MSFSNFSMFTKVQRPQATRRRSRKKTSGRFELETLEPRQMLTANPLISEFGASNLSVIDDEDGDPSDWIEIFNAGTSDVNLEGYSLTDDPANLDLWQFPSVTLAAGEYLVVFASGKDRAEPDSELHTNFQLQSGGEYLALVAPDELTVLQEFDPYPAQVQDISYGFGISETGSTLLEAGSPGQYLVPTDGSLETSWNQFEFDDATWSSGSQPFGYDNGESEPFDYGLTIDGLAPVGRWTFDGNMNDSTNNDLDGSKVAGSYVASPLGQALSIPAAFDFGFVPNSVANFDVLKPVSEVSVALWVKSTGSFGDLVSLGDHYRVRLNSDRTIEFAYDDSAGADTWTSVTTNPATETLPADGDFHLVVAQKKSTGLEIWIDG
ncbi:MAG: lamin tail domain-containing protein, partial [Planctomycetales bacterium]|nr:lamin tail domain-containing protein [Planctomycetales bacterium]